MKEVQVSVKKFAKLAGITYPTFKRYCQNYQVSRWLSCYGQQTEFKFCKESIRAFRRLLRNMDEGQLKQRLKKFDKGLEKLELEELLN